MEFTGGFPPPVSLTLSFTHEAESFGFHRHHSWRATAASAGHDMTFYKRAEFLSGDV